MHDEVKKLRKTEGSRAAVARAVQSGSVLSTVVFSRFWSNISPPM